MNAIIFKVILDFATMFALGAFLDSLVKDLKERGYFDEL